MESYIHPTKMDSKYNDIPNKKKFVIRKKHDVDDNNILAAGLRDRVRKRQSKKVKV